MADVGAVAAGARFRSHPPAVDALGSYADTPDDPARMVPNPAKKAATARGTAAEQAVAAAESCWYRKLCHPHLSWRLLLRCLEVPDQRPGRQVHQRVRRCLHRHGIRIIRTPVQAPRANAICKRWISSARRECTDRVRIAGPRHLRHALSAYVDHYNTHRPHRALCQRRPDGTIPVAPADKGIRVRRRDRFGGLIHEYSQAA